MSEVLLRRWVMSLTRSASFRHAKRVRQSMASFLLNAFPLLKGWWLHSSLKMRDSNLLGQQQQQRYVVLKLDFQKQNTAQPAEPQGWKEVGSSTKVVSGLKSRKFTKMFLSWHRGGKSTAGVKKKNTLFTSTVFRANRPERTRLTLSELHWDVLAGPKSH